MLTTSTRGFQEYVTGVGAMNTRVAADARRTLLRLGVLRHGRPAVCGVRRRQMALQTNLVHVGLNQQLVVRSTVREVAESATRGFDCRVFINKGDGCRRVAFGTHDELPGGSAQRVFFYGTVRIVAVGAINYALFNSVVKGHGELRLDFVVALKAKLRLLQLKQMFRRAGRMNGVAADAAHIAPAMGRMLKVCVLASMACLAFFIHLFGRGRGGAEDQCSVAALSVCIARSMTAFAGHVFSTGDEP